MSSLLLRSIRTFQSPCFARHSIDLATSTWPAKFSTPSRASSIFAHGRPSRPVQPLKLQAQTQLERWRSRSVAPAPQHYRRAYATNHDNDPDSQKPSHAKKLPLAALTSHENIYNIPNILTFTRLIAAPACGYLILHSHPFGAAVLFFYAGVTDLLDGYIARAYSLQTVVGSVIDPMADKLLMTTVVSCLAYSGAMPLSLAVVILGRDVSLAVAALYYRGASLPAPKTVMRYWDFSLPSAQVHPTTLSKYNTLLQLLLIGWHMVLPLLPVAPEVLEPVFSGMGSVLQALGIGGGAEGGWDAFTRVFQVGVAGTTLWSGLSYAFLKSAVTILGNDEKLKQKQGKRGRAIIGATYLGFIAFAGWLLVKEDSGEERQDRGSIFVNKD